MSRSVPRRPGRRAGDLAQRLRDGLRQARLGARRIPRAALFCALVGFLNAASWSVLMPVFQIPDEVGHFAYVQQIGETGRPPSIEARTVYSPELKIALADLHTDAIHLQPDTRVVGTAQQQQRLLDDLDADPGRRGNGGADAAAYSPPLYYALAAIPYRLGAGGNLLQRIALIRLLSALLGGFTVLFIFLFLRESFPGTPWAWTVGALGAALQPVFGQMSGGINPDALLYAASAAVFFCLARGFRRGLTAPWAVATGLALAVGFLGKTNFIGIVPGALLGLLLIGMRHGDGTWRETLRAPAIALASAVVPILIVGLLNVALYDRPIVGGVSESIDTTTTNHGTLLGELSYMWQFYLPPLPGMERAFPFFTARELWLQGFLGTFGWVDTIFSRWVLDVALVLVCAAGALLAASLIRNRAVLRTRISELVTYAAMALGLLALVAMGSYMAFLTRTGTWAQARYLLPLMSLFAAAAVAASLGVGRRWARIAGIVIVLIVVWHDVFSQLLVVARYYT